MVDRGGRRRLFFAVLCKLMLNEYIFYFIFLLTNLVSPQSPIAVHSFGEAEVLVQNPADSAELELKIPSLFFTLWKTKASVLAQMIGWQGC